MLCHSEPAQSASENLLLPYFTGCPISRAFFAREVGTLSLLRGCLALLRSPRRFFRHRRPPLSRSLTRRPAASCMRAIPALLQHQRDMRNPPLIPVSPSLRRRTNPLHPRPVIRNRALHVQIVDLNIEILLSAKKVRVVERRLQQLADMRCHPLLREQKSVARLFHLAPFDQFQYQARLLRRHSQVTHFSSKFHILVSVLSLSLS